ncbi:MAG: class I SAM-dependent methyltransferase [Bacteroidota bacterium]|nr:class I SAM-dependent methyltransferase [Bacteroidota bacterium]
MSNNLKNFYEDRYKEDALKKELRIIEYTKYPTNRIEACLKYFKDINFTGEILELGAGDGTMANTLLNSNLKITKYLATDFAENRLVSIKNNINSDILDVKQIDVDSFDANEYGKYDAVIMLALIEHLFNPIVAMKEVRKLLKPDGIAFVQTPNIADLGHRLKLLRGRFPSTASKNEGLTPYKGGKVENYDQGHLHYFTYRSLSLMLKNNCEYSKTNKYYTPTGKLFFGKKIHNFLAKIKPEMFSSVFIVAHY